MNVFLPADILTLATAKVCYENYKKTHSDTENANAPARYAMVELENIHDKALEFSPIHRIVTETDEEALLDELQKHVAPRMDIQYNGIRKSAKVFFI